MKTVFESLGWKVKLDSSVDANEDFPWLVIDSDGDECDWFDSEADAKEFCERKSKEDACEKLADKIANEVNDCEDLETLRKIAKLLGL